MVIAINSGEREGDKLLPLLHLEWDYSGMLKDVLLMG